MIPALGMVILPQNPSTENGHVPGCSCILSVDRVRSRNCDRLSGCTCAHSTAHAPGCCEEVSWRGGPGKSAWAVPVLACVAWHQSEEDWRRCRSPCCSSTRAGRVPAATAAAVLGRALVAAAPIAARMLSAQPILPLPFDPHLHTHFPSKTHDLGGTFPFCGFELVSGDLKGPN